MPEVGDLDIRDDDPGDPGVSPDPAPGAKNQDTPSPLSDSEIEKITDPAEKARAKAFQADYTRKTQEVAEQRKALEAERETYKWAADIDRIAREEGPAAAGKALAAVANELMGDTKPDATDRGANAQPTVQPGQQLDSAALNELYETGSDRERLILQVLAGVAANQQFLLKELNSAKEVLQSTSQSQSKREIDAKLTGLHATYKQYEPDFGKYQAAVVNYAVEHGIESLEDAAKLVYHDQIVESARRGEVRRLKSDLPNADEDTTVTVRGTSGPAKDVDEAFLRAKAKLARRR